MKKKGYVGVMKQSKSAIDITQGILDLEDICCFQGRLRTRSLSHDFLSEQHQSDSEPLRALSQENVHGKIQALQKKLQTQKMHLGPPPLVIAIKQMEDHQHPSKVLTLSENLPHKFHLKSSSQGVLPHSINPILPLFCTSPPSPGVDFNTLPQFIPCLDNSAARHRMSIKPRNQRASTKSRRIPTSDGGRPCLESMIILERAESKIEDGIDDPKEMPHARSYSSQIIRPGKGLTTPAIKCPTSPLKLLKRADDYQLHAVCQSKEKEESALSISVDVGTKQILKSDVGMVAKRPNSAGPTRCKGSENHKESLYSSKLKGVEGSAVSTEYTPHHISLGTQQSHPETDKEQNTVATHAKSNALNRSRVQDTMQEHQLQSQPMKPLLQHRNALPLDNKYEGRNIHLISLMQHSSAEGCLHESTTQQRSSSFSVSSENSHERQRTRSFNEQVEQAGGNKEHVLSLIKPSTNLKTLDLHKNSQLKAIGNDTPQAGALEISTKPRNLTKIVSAGQECGDSLANKTCNMTVETQGGVEEVDKANKEMKMNTVSAEQKEEISTEINVKQHNTKVKTTPWLTESTTHTAISQNDSKVGPERETCTVFRSPPLYNNELFIVAECPVFPSIRPQSARMDQEKAELIRFPDLQASAGSPVNITRITPVCEREKNPLQSCTKESREASTELSWMTMAREKTKSLHQLFTNTLNDFAGLQTVTQPTASPGSRIFSQPSAGPVRVKHQISPIQPPVTLLETQIPTEHPPVSGIHLTQPPTQKSPICLTKSLINHSGRVDSSLKQTFATSQVQTTHFNERPGQMSTHSNTKQVQLTGMYISPTQFNPQMIHAAHQQLSERSVQQANPIQPFLPQSVTKPQVSQSLRLSLSPKLTPHQPAHQSPSPVLQHRPLRENLSALPLGKIDWISMPQGKRPAESQAQYTGGLGSKTLLIEQWHHQKPGAVKEVDQKSTPDPQTFNNQSLDDFLSVSNQSRFTELPVSPGPIRLDREIKYQKKTIPPLSPSLSSRRQSPSDSRQPTWMELAKRKSMAWSDKAMD